MLLQACSARTGVSPPSARDPRSRAGVGWEWGGVWTIKGLEEIFTSNRYSLWPIFSSWRFQCLFYQALRGSSGATRYVLKKI